MWRLPMSSLPLSAWRRILYFCSEPQLKTLQESSLNQPLPHMSSEVTSSSMTKNSIWAPLLGWRVTVKVSFQGMGLSFSPLSMILVLNSVWVPEPLLTLALTQFSIFPKVSKFFFRTAQRMVISTLDISIILNKIYDPQQKLLPLPPNPSPFCSLRPPPPSPIGHHCFAYDRLSSPEIQQLHQMQQGRCQQALALGLSWLSGWCVSDQFCLVIVNKAFQMKKLQNYLMKPQQLRKKLQNPRFRQDFIDWSKSNVSVYRDPSSKQSRSKSPVERIQHSMQLNSRKHPNSNKQNIRPQPSLRQYNSQGKQGPRASITKAGNADQHNRSTSTFKRNTSNAALGRGEPKVQHSLNAKNRYSSCASIDCNRKEKSVSHLVSTEEKKVRQRYSYRTRQGVQINNPNKTNQDSLVIKTNLADRGMNFYAVADGHGACGHHVSQYLVKNVSKLMESELKNTSLYESIPRVFHKLQNNMTESDINVTCSGSTFVGVFIDNQEIVCCNVGDSRAILARQIDRKSWELIYLSQDHKPSVEAEKKRILKQGGRIHAFRDEHGHPVGPQRVWLPNQNMQGLAMSRSFGDNVSKTVGVTCDPEVIKMKLDKRDRFVLLASDGVWQFISNQEVLQLIVPYYKEGKLQEACNALSRLAYERWTVEDNSVVDDITLVLIFLSSE